MTKVLDARLVGPKSTEVADHIGFCSVFERARPEWEFPVFATRFHYASQGYRRRLAVTAIDPLETDGIFPCEHAAEELVEISAAALAEHPWFTTRVLGPFRRLVRVRLSLAATLSNLTHFAHVLTSRAAPCYTSGDLPSDAGRRGGTLLPFPQRIAAVTRTAQDVPHHQRDSSAEDADGSQKPSVSPPRIFDAPDGIGPPVLHVVVGRERMRLFGVISNEQAIAHIEERLRGRRATLPTAGRSLPPPFI